MKTCTKCKIEKLTKDFGRDITTKDGLKFWCKVCKKKDREDNSDYHKEHSKKWREDHPEEAARYHQDWYLDNKPHRKQYLEDNKDTIKETHAKYIREREKVDPNFRLANRLRARLYKITKGLVKAGSAIKDLGCTISELREYLETKFQEGMTWDNYGEWHVDHVKPISKFDLSDRTQFLEACNYSNLQPLWAGDNIRKSDNDIPPSPIHRSSNSLCSD